jgi:hypothetical protein
MKWLLLLFALALSKECSELLELPTQEEAIAFFEENKAMSVTEDCILKSIDKEWWDFATKLTIGAIDTKVDLTEAIRKKAMSRKRQIDLFTAALESKSTVQTVSPAF